MSHVHALGMENNCPDCLWEKNKALDTEIRRLLSRSSLRIKNLKSLLEECRKGFVEISVYIPHPSDCDGIHKVCNELLKKLEGLNGHK